MGSYTSESMRSHDFDNGSVINHRRKSERRSAGELHSANEFVRATRRAKSRAMFHAADRALNSETDAISNPRLRIP